MNRIYPIGKKIRHDYIIIKRCYVLFLYFCPGFNLENKSEMFKENLNLFNSNTGQKSTTSGLVKSVMIHNIVNNKTRWAAQ